MCMGGLYSYDLEMHQQRLFLLPAEKVCLPRCPVGLVPELRLVEISDVRVVCVFKSKALLYTRYWRTSSETDSNTLA
jgi:hypothetical protein